MPEKYCQLEYSTVLDPCAELPVAEKVQVLAQARKCSEAAAKKVLSESPQASLLDLKRSLNARTPARRAAERRGTKRGGAAAAAAPPPAWRRTGIFEGVGGDGYDEYYGYDSDAHRGGIYEEEVDSRLLAREKAVDRLSHVKPGERVAGLARMLLEAEVRSKKQAKFEASLEPPTKKRRVERIGIDRYTYEPISNSCDACLDAGIPKSKLVVCRAQSHVYCCSCVRTYMLGSKLHGGLLGMIICPGCEEGVRADMYVERHGKPNEGKKVLSQFEKNELLPWGDVSRVVGPVDELRMHDCRVASGKKAKLKASPEVLAALSRAGARACPYCGDYAMKHSDGACSAVVCGNCSRIFNWRKARKVTVRKVKKMKKVKKVKKTKKVSKKSKAKKSAAKK